MIVTDSNASNTCAAPPALALHDEASEPMPLSSSDALERALRMLDATPVTLTHKFGVLYVAGGQQHEAVSRKCHDRYN